jgi:hypothetical protein
MLALPKRRKISPVGDAAMRFRIAMWAGLGALVAIGWAVYSFSANPSPIPPTKSIVWTFALLTQPIAFASVHYRFGVSVNWVILANALTYGLIGLLAETMRRKLRHAA